MLTVHAKALHVVCASDGLVLLSDVCYNGRCVADSVRGSGGEAKVVACGRRVEVSGAWKAAVGASARATKANLDLAIVRNLPLAASPRGCTT